MMVAHGLLGACFSLLFLLIIGHSVTALGRWDPDGPVTVSKSSTVTMTCRVTARHPFKPSVIRKKNGDTEVQVSENGFPQGKYLNQDLYIIDYLEDRTDQSATITFNITNAEGHDTGIYQCYQTGDKVKAERQLVVQVPVEKVWIVSLEGEEDASEVEPGASVLLRQGEMRGVACLASASDSHVSPNLNMSIDGLDVSAQFSSQNYSETQQGVVSRVTKSSYVTMSPKPEHHLKNITCVASMPSFPTKSTYATFNVEYKPAITCTKYEHYGQVGQNLTVSCTVMSNPVSTIKLKHGPSDDNALPNVTMEERAVSADAVDVTFTFVTLTPADFTSYTLIAENDVDESSLQFVLFQGASTIKYVNKETPKPNEVVGAQGSLPRGHSDRVIPSLLLCIMSLMSLQAVYSEI